MSDIRLRPAQLADLLTLSRLARDAKSVWGYERSWIEAWTSELTITPDDLDRLDIAVAHLEGEVDTIAGFAAVDFRESAWTLEHCWVAPRFMRRGVGSALYRHVTDTIASHGGGVLTIVSDPHAVPFYERVGAAHIGDVAAPMPGASGRTLPVLEQEISARA